MGFMIGDWPVFSFYVFLGGVYFWLHKWFFGGGCISIAFMPLT